MKWNTILRGGDVSCVRVEKPCVRVGAEEGKGKGCGMDVDEVEQDEGKHAGKEERVWR